VKTRLALLVLFATAAPVWALAEEAPKPQAPPSSSPTDVTGVVVTGQKPAVTTSIDRRSYSVSGDLQAQSGSIADALRSVPSVDVDVQGNVSLRGDSNVTILIDGKPSTQFQGDNQGQALQQLPANQIDRVEVITNPSAEFSGNGSGGIINLVTRKARGSGLTGGARASVGDDGRLVAGGNLGFNSSKLSLTGDATYRRDVQKLEIADDRRRLLAGGFDDTTQDQLAHFKADSFAARGGLDYDLDARTRLGLQGRLNVVDFTLESLARFESEDPFGVATGQFDRNLDVSQHRRNGQLGASLRRKLAAPGSELTLNLTYDVTADDRQRDGQSRYGLPAAPDAFDRQTINNLFRQTDFRGDYVRPLGGGATLKLGFDLQHDENDYVNRGFKGPSFAALGPDPVLTNRYDFSQTLTQGYVSYEQPIGSLTVLAGLRLEQTELDLAQVTQGRIDSQSFLTAFPSLHLAWKLDDSRQFTASYSRRIQRPNPFDYNAFRYMVDPLTFRAGNPDLRPQQTDSFELGYELRPAPATRYLATLFYRENRGGVADVVSPLGGGAYLITRVNAASSRSGGLELVAAGRFSPSLTYTLSGTAAWIQLDSLGPGLAPTRSATSFGGRANLNWQATPDDLVQLNTFVQGKRLTPQGFARPAFGVNLGYRHKLTDQVSLVVTAQDVFGSFRDRLVVDTPTLKGRTQTRPDSQQLTIGLTWTFGGGKPREPSFDYGGGITPPTQ
jgi:outer membrane receptor protein involved in Fe transport